jgi:hypothetical protein
MSLTTATVPHASLEPSRKRKRSLTEIVYSTVDNNKRFKTDDLSAREIGAPCETNVREIFEAWNVPLADLMGRFFFSGIQIYVRQNSISTDLRDDRDRGTRSNLGEIETDLSNRVIVSDRSDFLRRLKTEGKMGSRLIEDSKESRVASTSAISALKDVCNFAMSCKFLYEKFNSSYTWKTLQTVFRGFRNIDPPSYGSATNFEVSRPVASIATSVGEDFATDRKKKKNPSSSLSSRRYKPRKRSRDASTFGRRVDFECENEGVFGKEALLDKIVGPTKILEREIYKTLMVSSAYAIDATQTLRRGMPENHILVSVKKSESETIYFGEATEGDALGDLVSMPVSHFVHLKKITDALHARKMMSGASAPRSDNCYLHYESSSKMGVYGA